MADFRLPGPVCLFLGTLEIDAGTMCRTASPVPGVSRSPKKRAIKTKPPRTYQEHFGAVKDPLSYVDKAVYLNDSGSPQCAVLVKQLAGAPRTGDNGWQKGTNLTADSVDTLEVGTPIATGWNAEGFYPNNTTGQHSGIFAGPEKGEDDKTVGFTIVEQYSGLDTIKKRVVFFDPVSAGKKNTYFYRGTDYYTIKW